MADLSMFTDIMVNIGPVVGTVTSTSAIVLLEVDQDCTITIVLTSPDGNEVRQRRTFPQGRPRSFYVKGLQPDTVYTYTFQGLGCVATKDINEYLQPKIKTMPEKVDKLRIIAQSCDRPRRVLEGDENPWDRLLKECEDGKCDVMLHLGDQVYTEMDGFLERAEMRMRHYKDPCAGQSEKRKMIRAAGLELRGAYYYTWGLPSTRATLAQSSHLMIWSDNDSANDFTEKFKPNGEQYYSDQFLIVANRIYTEYQRQLWDPECDGILPHEDNPSKVNSSMEEWHFHQYGGLGIFMIDMRGNRITCGGVVKRHRKLMSERQKQALRDAFASPGLSCMLLCSEIPFVTSQPKVVQRNATKFDFLEGHWCYDEVNTAELFDFCFDWKAEKPGRQVVMIGGDVHIGFTTELSCNKTNSTIMCVTTSPITNHVCDFYEEMEGDFNERYHFKHQIFPDMRNYCVVEASFDDDGSCGLDIKMELIPATPDH